jgi:hypothetical protein
MIDAARRAAEETLLDQTLVRVDRETYEHFLTVLDHPPSGEGYERLMAASSPFRLTLFPLMTCSTRPAGDRPEEKWLSRSGAQKVAAQSPSWCQGRTLA